MLLKASSFCLSSALGLAICSMEVIPASFIFFAVAGPIPFTRVRSDLSAGLAAFGVAVFLVAGFLAGAFFAAGLLPVEDLAADFALLAVSSAALRTPLEATPTRSSKIGRA